MPRRPDTHPQTLAVLRLLAEEPTNWHYGYDIARRTGLRSGTLYPLLVRLSERGHLEAEWEDSPPPGRPRRHLYRITASGAELVAAEAAPRPARRSPTRPVLGGGAA